VALQPVDKQERIRVDVEIGFSGTSFNRSRRLYQLTRSDMFVLRPLGAKCLRLLTELTAVSECVDADWMNS
jgi:hypothetical protein